MSNSAAGLQGAWKIVLVTPPAANNSHARPLPSLLAKKPAHSPANHQPCKVYLFSPKERA